MAKERNAYAPFSLTSEAGVAQTPVEGYIDVRQEIYPTVATGTINENGKWTGVKSNDVEFIGFSKAEAIPNGGDVLFPDSNNHPSINMEGFVALQFALKVSSAGSYQFHSKFGPDTIRFANLSPVASGQSARITDPNGTGFEDIVSDGGETLIADAWHIFTVAQTRARDQQNLQIKVVNDTGSNTNLEFAFRRLV